MNMIKKIKNGLINSFIFGSVCGLVPNKINLQINDTRFTNVRGPIIGGLIGIGIFMFSPFLLTNYFFRGVYFDKQIDKYNFDIKRTLQYDGNDNNKYGFPSNITINISSKQNPYQLIDEEIDEIDEIN